MFHKLSDNSLIDAYIKANSLDLDHYFISLIEKELTKRGLSSIRLQCCHAANKAVKED